MKNKSNIKQTKDGLIEKSTGRKIESTLDLGKTATLFTGYFGVVPKNMAVPVALFISKSEAEVYSQTEYANDAIIKKFPTSSLLFEALRQC